MNNEELMHYGVRGMKWGVHKAVNELNSSRRDGGIDRGMYNHAVAVLSSHRTKINKKLSKLESKRTKLDNKVYEQETKSSPKIAKMHNKAMKLRVKADRTVNSEKRDNLRAKANKLEYKVSKIQSQAAKTRAKIAKNERLQQEFKKGLSTINKETVDKGREFLYMRSNGIPYTNADIDSWTNNKK